MHIVVSQANEGQLHPSSTFWVARQPCEGDQLLNGRALHLISAHEGERDDDKVVWL